MTYNGQKLLNPPIREAIFHISFQNAVQQDLLTNFVNSEYIASAFPHIFPNYTFEIARQANKETLSTNAKPQGYSLRTMKGDRVAQLQTTQLSYHSVSQYVGWDVMYEELRSFWNNFCQSIGKTDLSQVSVRYINTFSVSLEEAQLNEFVTLIPVVPPELTNGVGNFLLQIQFPLPDRNILGIVTETLNIDKTNFDSNKTVDLIIDINVVNSGPFDCNQEPMWLAFQNIREFKNKLFFSILTERTLNKFL